MKSTCAALEVSLRKELAPKEDSWKKSTQGMEGENDLLWYVAQKEGKRQKRASQNDEHNDQH